MQSKINDYLNSKQFQEDRAYFHEILEDIESSKTELLTQEQYDKEMKAFEKSL